MLSHLRKRKKTAAHVVADVLFDFGLISSKEIVVMSAQSIVSRSRNPKAGIFVIEVSKDSDWYDYLTYAMETEAYGNVVIIIAGDYFVIDFAMETRPEIKTLFSHTFDLGSWTERY